MKHTHTLSLLRTALCVLAVALLGACRIVPYESTLPDWVRRIYVPIAENRTHEPGLGESITNAFVLEIQADGRLEVVQRTKCDIEVRVILLRYREKTAEFETDDIERRRRITLEVMLELYDAGRGRKTPWARVEAFEISMNYPSDYRSFRSELDVDAKERMAEHTGLELLHKLLREAVVVEDEPS